MLTEELMREVRRLQIRTRRRVDALFAGEYHSAFKGQGVEFADVRPYEPGDDVRAIDWNVTARTGSPHIKRFIEERQLTITLAIDASASGQFGSGQRSLRRASAELAAIITLAAAQNHDKVGLLLFTDRIERHVPPALGPTHTLRLIREVMGAEPIGSGTDIPAALDTLARLQRRRSILFLISDFLIPPSQHEPLERALRRLSARHEPIAAVLDDPALHTLPRMGLVTVRDPETGRPAVLDTSSASARRAMAARAERTRDATRALLRRAGTDILELSTHRPLATDVAAFLHRRDRRR